MGPLLRGLYKDGLPCGGHKRAARTYFTRINGQITRWLKHPANVKILAQAIGVPLIEGQAVSLHFGSYRQSEVVNGNLWEAGLPRTPPMYG